MIHSTAAVVSHVVCKCGKAGWAVADLGAYWAGLRGALNDHWEEDGCPYYGRVSDMEFLNADCMCSHCFRLRVKLIRLGVIHE